MTTAAASSATAVRRLGMTPLSFAQERLWFLEQLVPGTAVQNVPLAARMRGHIDLDVLERAIGTLVERHETLRTAFISADGEPMQRVLPELRVPLEVFDAGDATPDGPQIAARLAQLAAVPFDLTAPPLLRATLLRHGPDDHTLLFVMHHIISDGWSVGVLFKELFATIAGLHGGTGSPLPPLPIQYGDFAVRQRERYAAGDFDADLDYWRDRLGSTVPALDLPMARPRVDTGPAIAAGGRVSLELGTELSAALDAFGRAHRSTLYMTLLSGYVALLARHRGIGQEDGPLVVGTPIANRNDLDIEGLIGFFVNALALRFDITTGMSMRELLRHVRTVAIGAFGHQNIPFEKLVAELRPERQMSQAPLFQTMFVLQNAGQDAGSLPGLDVEPLDVHTGTAKFDLLLSVAPRDGGLVAALEYDAGRFDEDTAARLLHRYAALLEAAVAEPETPLRDLPMLPGHERAELLGNGRRRAEPAGAGTLHELLAAQTRRTPGAVAVTFAGEDLTYTQLDQAAGRLARRLHEQGVRPGDRVALLIDRSLWTVTAIAAVLRAGAVYVPLDPAYPTARLNAIVTDARPAVLLTQAHMAGQLPDSPAPVLLLDELDLAGAEPLPPVPAGPDAGAYVIYTSGSTGTPKGVLITHRNVIRLFEAAEELFTFGPDDVWTLFHSYAFDFSVWEMWGALLYGGRVVVVPTVTARSAEAYYELVRDEGVTVLNQTPSAFVPFSAAAVRAGDALALRYVVFGGEALDPQTLGPWIARYGDQQPLLVNMYGITETTVHVTYRVIRAADAEQPGRSPIGIPLADLELFVLDGSAMHPAPAGVPGELYVGGAGLARAYLNSPALTADRFVPHPFTDRHGARLYRTGDLARVMPDGAVEYLGRIDHQVKIRGFRIETGEVEAGLLAHPAITAAVVQVHETGDGDRRLVGYLVPDPAALDAVASPPGTGPNFVSRNQIAEWEQVFDGMYGSAAGALADDFDITGWNSTYTNAPLPAEEMREWVSATVAAVRDLRPRRILEVGCGTGLLLHRLAPHAVEYVGTDLSADAIATLKSRVTADHVTLLHQAADVVCDLPNDLFDTVVINSVVQYFPEVEYLTTVLSRIAGILPYGAAIFVGDVRDLRLVQAFHLSVELARAAGDMPLTRLRGQVTRRVQEEEELLCDPRYFRALSSRIPRLASVEVRPRRGRFHNEMSCFRYDVVLRLDEACPPVPETEVAWSPGLDLTALLAPPAGGRPLRVAAITNPRVEASVRALDLLERAAPGSTVVDLRRETDRAPATGVEIEAVAALAEAAGRSYRFHPNADLPGAYDLVLDGGPGEVAVADAGPLGAPELYANDPPRALRRRRLVPSVREFLGRQVPGYMVPAAFVVVDALPLTPNGKVDRDALPAADADSVIRETGHVAPRTEAEAVVTRICAEVLGLERVGADDNFFEIGGHSLVATRFVYQLREAFDSDIPLRVLFESPTMAGIAAAIGSAGGGDHGAADLIADVRLSSDIVPTYPVIEVAADPCTALLTGATGFLGAFLLRELLDDTDVTVHCLVRGDSPAHARDRLAGAITRFELDLPWDRIVVHAGNLAEPWLGLGENHFDDLARTVDVVYHAGASVNLVYPYAQLKAGNVTGTEQVLRLAARHRTVPVHYVSTIGVFGADTPAEGPDGTIRQDAPTGPPASLGTGYTRSKWVAEQIVGVARDRGLPITVYRPSRISGDTRSGACQGDDYLWRVLKGCVQAGAVPAGATIAVDLVPVDYVAGAIRAISRSHEPGPVAYHLTHRRPVILADMVRRLRDLGYPLAELPFPRWCERVEADPDNAAYPLLGVLQEGSGGMTDALFDITETQSALSGTGVHLPDIDDAAFARTVDYFVRTGYLPVPGAPA
ncbi:amino acid adenylation domain-containing protein [Dactylosporangium sp. NPDC000555]|uniref:non-ribosomal peptide synthetase family protein n=1 Tax=Dactylosporangium sp. NPDC000555 TaxID=3154260 RepID=UPI00331ACF42